MLRLKTEPAADTLTARVLRSVGMPAVCKAMMITVSDADYNRLERGGLLKQEFINGYTVKSLIGQRRTFTRVDATAMRSLEERAESRVEQLRKDIDIMAMRYVW